jgi:hypothetical protein
MALLFHGLIERLRFLQKLHGGDLDVLWNGYDFAWPTHLKQIGHGRGL